MQLRLNQVFAGVAAVLFAYLFYACTVGKQNFFTRHVDYQRQRAKAKIELTQLNYLIPPFAPLAEFGRTQEGLKAADWDKYAAYFEKVRELMPGRWDVYVFLGYCYFYQGQTGRAVEAFEKSINLNPRSFWSYYNLALIAAQQGNGPVAAVLLSRALQISVKDVLSGMFTSKLYVDVRNSVADFDALTEKHLQSAYESAYRLGALAARPDFQAQVQALAGRLAVLIF